MNTPELKTTGLALTTADVSLDTQDTTKQDDVVQDAAPIVDGAAVDGIVADVGSIEGAKLDEEDSLKFVFSERNPSDWEISPFEEGIRASNNRTGKVFEGSIVSFNRKLNGL